MASNLRVDNIQPSTGMGIGIGTANGSVTFNADVTGGMNITTGSFGVGTDNPTEKIDVNGGLKVYANTNIATFKNNQLRSDAAGAYYFDHGTTGQSFTFRTSTSSSLDTTGPSVTSAGNISFPSGKGIDFSATSDGSGASNVSELLNDYEEGTFTPSLTFATPGTSSFSYSVQSGWYTKIGRMVHYRLEIRLNAFSKGTASGDLRVSGLPFTAANLGAGQFTGSFAAFFAPLPTTAGHFPFFGARLNSTEGFFKVLRNDNSWTTFPDPDSNSQYKCDVTLFTT